LGLLSHNKSYNITHVQRGLAFENSLIDAVMQLSDFPQNSYLVGAVDEISSFNYNIELLKSNYTTASVTAENFYQSGYKASMAGEGAAMFLVNGTSENAIAKLVGIDTVHTNVLPTMVPNISPLFAALTSPINVVFNVDVTNAVNRYNSLPIAPANIKFVGMRGGADWLGNWTSGGGWVVSDTTVISGKSYMKVLTKGANNIWSYTAVCPIGTLGGIFEYKYAAYYTGADTVNGGSSPLDNENGFGRNHNFILKKELGPTITINDKFGTLTMITKDNDLRPKTYTLAQNYPNPFNPSTIISYEIPKSGLAVIKIFNVLGQEVRTIVNEVQSAGVHQISFNAGALKSGVYFYRLIVNNISMVKKMLYLK